MKRLFFALGIILCFSNISFAQKWYQQKNNDFFGEGTIGSDSVYIQGPRNQMGGVWLDFDNDGLKDFIIPCYYNRGSFDVQQLRFYKNLGNGSFIEVTSKMVNPNIKNGKYFTGMNDNRAIVFDFNKDGKNDFIFPSAWENNNYSNYDSLYGFVKMRDYYYNANPKTYIENRANGGFQSPSFFYQDSGVIKKGYNLFDTKTFTVDRDVQHSDINNDGFEDLITFSSGYKLNPDTTINDWIGGITIWKNDSGKKFKFSQLKLIDTINKYEFGLGDDGKIAIGDFNNDGFKDILLYGAKSPYKAKRGLSGSVLDSLAWDVNYRELDTTLPLRPTIYETRVYLNNNGNFSENNYFVIPGLRAKYPNTIDINGDGKLDIIAQWKNYRAVNVYTDSVNNKDGINNQFYVYINKGANQFEDQTKTYFPYDSTKFSRMSTQDFYIIDIDGDGFKDFFPISGANDTLRGTLNTYATDTAGSHSSVYYKNYNNQFFKKTILDSFLIVKDWYNFSVFKNVDSMFSQFYIPYSNSNNPISPKGEYLLDQNYYLNQFYVEDINNDGKNELIGLKSYDNRIEDFLSKKYNYSNKLYDHVGFSVVSQCAPLLLDQKIIPICGNNLPTNKTIHLLNYNYKDSVFWNYNGTIIKNSIDTFVVKNIGWLTAIRKDSNGCLSLSSDTLYIKNSLKPNMPRLYYSGSQRFSNNNLCKYDTITLNADVADTLTTGIIKWFNNGIFFNNSNPGSVQTHTGGGRFTNPGSISVFQNSNFQITFLSDEGCSSDTTTNYQITVFDIPNPPSTSPLFLCKNSSPIQLSAQVLSGNSLIWYGSNISGGIGSTVPPTPNTTIIGTTDYYVSQKNNLAGCEGPRSKITVSINDFPNAPQVSDTTFCQNITSSKLNAINTSGSALAWYGNNATGGTATISNPSAVTSDTTTKYYYVSQINSTTGCESPRAKITVKINPAPGLPTVRDTSYCNNANVDTLRVNPSTGNSLLWYGTNATGGTGNILASKPTTNIVGTFGYYVSQQTITTGCEGQRAKINVTISPLPSTPLVRDTAYCNNATSDTIRVNPSTGNSLLWYGTNANGGTATSTSVKPSTYTVGTTSYYVSQQSNATGCEGPRSKINITTYPIPSAPVLSRDTANNLIASINGITWYKDGTAITDTTQKIKPTTGGSYTAKTTQNGCVSALSSPYYYLVTDIINLSAEEYIKLAPNPFTNQLNFDFVLKGYQRLNIEVFDLANGSKVASKQNLTPGIPIYLGQLSAGTYVIKVTSNDIKVSYQFKMVKL